MARLNWVGYAPHIRSRISVSLVYIFWLIALMPTTVWGIYYFGVPALLLLVVSTASAFLTEIVFNLIRYKKFVFTDLSSVVTGLLIGLVMPPGVPLYYPVIGAVLTIMLIKMCFGGTGKNFVSEVAVSKILIALMFGLSFANSYILAGAEPSAVASTIEVVKQGGGLSTSLLSMVVGQSVGAIGEVSILCIVLGGLFLCFTKTIDWIIPTVYLLVFTMFALIFDGFETTLNYLLSSGIIFVSFFVATDYGSTPKMKVDKALYAIIVATLNILIWEFSPKYALAPYYAVLIAGVLCSAFNIYLRPQYAKEKKYVEKNRT